MQPGRIRGRVEKEGNDDDAEVEENLAFSSQYIAARRQGINLSSVIFQIHRIGPGQPFAFEASDAWFRLCSVATGKVHVTLGRQQFGIGAHGMWRVRAGEKCSVQNLGASTAIVHVSMIDCA